MMDAGAKTYRPHAASARILKYMRNHDQAQVLATKSDGVLLGALLPKDIERAVESA